MLVLQIGGIQKEWANLNDTDSMQVRDLDRLVTSLGDLQDAVERESEVLGFPRHVATQYSLGLADRGI